MAATFSFYEAVSMPLSSERSSFTRRTVVSPDVATYAVLPFAHRSAAVRYCRRVSDVLDESDWACSDGSTRHATVWLATVSKPGSDKFRVFACEVALAAAQSVGIDGVVTERVREEDMPVTRCLVIGDPRLVTP